MAELKKIEAYSGDGEYIFVSYAHKDRDLVYPFIAALQKKYNVWFDEGIRYGSEWTHEIVSRLKKCSVFIFMITENSLVSENCKDELHHAREQKKNFLNIQIKKETVLPEEFKFRYGRYQMCNYFEFSSPDAVVDDLERKCDWFDSVKKDLLSKFAEETKKRAEVKAEKQKIKAAEDEKARIESKQNEKEHAKHEEERMLTEVLNARQKSDGTYIVSGFKRIVSHLTIPNCVSEIAEEAFKNNSEIETVTIPNSVKKIGKGAFRECRVHR